MRTKILTLFSILFLASLANAAHIRFVSGVTAPDAFTSVWFREALLFSNVPYGDITSYIFIPPGSYDATMVISTAAVTLAGTSNATNVPFTFTVNGNNTYSLVAHGTPDNAAVLQITDNLPGAAPATAANETQATVSGNATAAETSASATEGTGASAETSAETSATGARKRQATEATATAETSATAAPTSGPAPSGNENVFLRVVNVSPSPVTVTVAGETLVSNLASLTASNYTQLSTAPTNVTITVSNGTIPLLSILGNNTGTIWVLPQIQGQEAIAPATAFGSNDVIPVTMAKLRLINAWKNQPNPISMSLDGTPLFSNIAYGQLSDYATNLEAGLHHITLGGAAATSETAGTAGTAGTAATSETAGTAGTAATSETGATAETAATGARKRQLTGTEATAATATAGTAGPTGAPSADLWFVVQQTTSTTVAKINPTTQDLPLAFYGSSAPNAMTTFGFWLFREFTSGNQSAVRIINLSSFASVSATLGNVTTITGAFLEDTTYTVINAGSMDVNVVATDLTTGQSSSATASLSVAANNDFRTLWTLDSLNATGINVTVSIDRPNDPVKVTIIGIDHLIPIVGIPIEDWFMTFSIPGATPPSTSRVISVIMAKPGKYCFTNPPVFVTPSFTFGITVTGFSLPTFTPLPNLNVAVINAIPNPELASVASVPLFGRAYRLRIRIEIIP